jgi:uncharacterized membrane protein YadS
MSHTSTLSAFDSKTLFFLGLLVAASGVVSPPVALAGGVVFGFAVHEHPLRRESATMAKLLLQVSVVALGFGMNLGQVLHAGRSGFCTRRRASRWRLRWVWYSDGSSRWAARLRC